MLSVIWPERVSHERAPLLSGAVRCLEKHHLAEHNGAGDSGLNAKISRRTLGGQKKNAHHIRLRRTEFYGPHNGQHQLSGNDPDSRAGANPVQVGKDHHPSSRLPWRSSNSKIIGSPPILTRADDYGKSGGGDRHLRVMRLFAVGADGSTNTRRRAQSREVGDGVLRGACDRRAVLPLWLRLSGRRVTVFAIEQALQTRRRPPH